jgi:hypothetical protein
MCVTLVVGGDHADNLGYQLGGWSISWQGGSGTTTIGTTLWQAIQQAGLSSSVKLNFVGTRTKGHYRGMSGSWCQQLPKIVANSGQSRSRRPGSVQRATVPFGLQHVSSPGVARKVSRVGTSPLGPALAPPL